MITAQIETFSGCVEEMKVMWPAHWEELAVYKDKMPLAPQYETYLRREAAGELIVPTVRANGKLIGYWMTFVAPGLHYGTTLTATMDILYIDPEYRGTSAAQRLAECLKSELKRRGVKLWYVGSKDHKPIDSFYKHLGFEPVETYFGMWLEEGI